MAEEIVPGVYGLSMGYVNAFLIADGELSLIDSGLPRRSERILKAVRDIGKGKSLAHIAITHHHFDHTGSLAALVAATGARVYVHQADAAIVRGDVAGPGPNPRGLLWRLAAAVIVRMTPKGAEPAPVDNEVEDGAELPIGGGLKAIHAPGHTPGSLAFLMPRHGGVLFAGDAAGNLFGRLGPPLGMFTEDMAEAKRSIARLAELEFEVACFGHGTVLRGQANASFRRLVERLAR